MARLTPRQRYRRVLYSFPVQLLVLHGKKNHLLLLSWLVLFGYVTGNIGVKYGVPYLFLFPEYFGRVSPWSHALTGFAFGGFVTAYNLFSYTLHAYRFPFIATIARPFLKFCVNNGTIPVLFTLTWLWCAARFQYTVELVPAVDVALNLFGLLGGMLLFLALAQFYFFRTNTDITKLTGRAAEEYRPEHEAPADIIAPMVTPEVRQEQRKATRWLRREQRTKKWHVETYLTGRLRVKLARSSSHYDRELLRSVLWQNHINGSIFEILVVITFIALGAFAGNALFEIPAGASAFLLFTTALLVLAALFSWLKGWTVTLILLLLVGLNVLSHSSDAFLYDNQAMGMDYHGPQAEYSRAHIARLALDEVAIAKDLRQDRERLLRWKQQQTAFGEGERPLMVIVNTSGGGLRAMLWTLRSMQAIDSLMGGTLMQRTTLITGSSGGLIGATYYRQLFAASLVNDTIAPQAEHWRDDMSGDMLNSIAFSFVTNDMFLRYRRVSDGDRLYTRDRGSAFEQRLNEMTHGLLDTRLDDQAPAEASGSLPLLVVGPAVVNDGRRLLIAASPIAHLAAIRPHADLNGEPQPESIEFRKLFAHQDAGRIKLTTALRMTSTFPYITPMVSLPSEPAMRVMDSGIRDNYGYRTTLQYLLAHREWIAANTRGVLIVQVRDKQRDLEVAPSSRSLWSRVVDPVGSVYGNFVKAQDQDYDLMLRLASADAGYPLHLIDLQLRHDESDEISLSWHLTALEKRHVLNTIRSAENQRALGMIARLMDRAAEPMLTDAHGSAPAHPAGPVPRN